MKKTMSIIFGAMLMLMLAACSQTADPVDKKGESKQGTSTEKEKASKDKENELTLEDVFKKSEAANKDVKSFNAKIDMKQTVEAAGQKQDINSDIDMSFVTEPMAMHQKMTMSLDGQKQEIDSYLTKDGFYMYEPTQKMWMKLPEELSGQILQMSEGQSNPSGQLEQLKAFVNEFDFKQDDKNYILTLKADGDKFDKFLKDSVQDALPSELQAEGLMNGMKFNKVDYEVFIDKETFYLNALNMVMEMSTEVEDQKMNMQMDMKSTYSDYNAVKDKDVEVPKEALENAQEVDMNQAGGQ